MQWAGNHTEVGGRSRLTCLGVNAAREDHALAFGPGARYFADADKRSFVSNDSDLSVCLSAESADQCVSIDPMSDDYPNQSPYMYCSGNPVMRIDSNGATGWQGRDFHDRKSASYQFYYANGFKFINTSHDIWGMGDNSVPHNGSFGKYNYPYESTYASGRTVFMKRTDASLQSSWPNYKSGDKKRRSMW